MGRAESVSAAGEESLGRGGAAKAAAVFEQDHAVAQLVPALLAVVGDDDGRSGIPIVTIRTNRRV